MSGLGEASGQGVAVLRCVGTATAQHLPKPTIAGATVSATNGATPDLKLLAERWFLRNAPRNSERNTTADRVLRGPSDSRGPTQHFSNDSDAIAERAAIVEEGAKVPRAWAEAFARFEVSGAPPAVVNGAGRALDAWARKAGALGWTPNELLKLASEGEVVALTADAATLRWPEGLRHARREP